MNGAAIFAVSGKIGTCYTVHLSSFPLPYLEGMTLEKTMKSHYLKTRQKDDL